jgi:hypothetical protein
VLGGGDPRPGDDLRQAAPGIGGDHEQSRDQDQESDRGHLHHLQPLERHVDDRGQRQDQSDDDQHRDGDPPRLAADRIGDHRRRTGRPAGPEVREVGHDREDQPPVPPEAAEAG